MTARVDPRTTARTGDHVKFALDAEKIHVFDKESRLFYDIERIWRDGKIMEAGEFAEHAGV